MGARLLALVCLVLGLPGMTAAAGCDRHAVCPPICVADDTEACTRITNSSQACELRKFTCSGCISATASALGLPLACVACVIDALAGQGEAAVGACSEICGGAERVEQVVKNNGC